MSSPTVRGRTDRASRHIKASPQAIYRALIDPKAVAVWLPPKGMTCQIHAFEPWAGGAYQVTLFYKNDDHASPGKTSAHADVVNGCFVALCEDECVVQRFAFESDDPDFAGTMAMTWQLAVMPDGTTEVTITCEGVPRGISAEDHHIGMSSTLANLAAFTEQ
jgi:uncharacterized protein YndB with AHSA1/START domain